MFRASFVGEVDGEDAGEFRRALIKEEEEQQQQDDNTTEPNTTEQQQQQSNPPTILSRCYNKINFNSIKNANLDLWLKRYELWLDGGGEHPIRSRCIVGALTAAIGAMLAGRSSNNHTAKFPAQSSKSTGMDWMQVLSFAIHGGLVAGPLSYYIDNFLEDNFFDSRSNAVLFDQILATPPQIFLTFFTVHVSKAALAAVPSAAKKSWSLLGATTADAWKFWPISIYLLLKAVKKRRQYAAAINLCSIAWAAHLAKKYSTNPQLKK